MMNMMAGPTKLDGKEKRKLVKEIRDEIKPLISQIAELMIEKATSVIKVQIRKFENDTGMEFTKVHDKIGREIKSTQEKAVFELRNVERDIKESIRSFQRQRARDKSDFDQHIHKQVETIKSHGEQLGRFGVNFEAIAIVNSMLIENINMQMEGEIADLLDRRMMSLFGVQSKAITKLDVQNTSLKL